MASTETCPFSSLALQGFRVQVSLGVGDQERSGLQFVSFDVKLKFARLPQACLSDNIDETNCYARLSEVIQNVCQHRPFHLIEHLGWQVFASLREQIALPTKLWIRVTKEKPPIHGLQKGATFCLGDWDET